MTDGLVLSRTVTERGVHDWAQRAAATSCGGMARAYVGYEEWAGGGFLRREPARCGVALILAFGDGLDVFDGTGGAAGRRLGAFVVGNQSHPSLTGVMGHQLGVQVELSAAGALALLGEVESYNDSVVPLEDALSSEGPPVLDRLATARSWEARLDLLDEWFGGREVPALSPEVVWLRRQLVASQGTARVEPLMDETGWSRRHLTEHFRRQLGISPKAYARLLRFQHAGALLLERRAGGTLADVAMEAGYYDQSHLSRDFAALAGMTPGSYAADARSGPEVRFVQDPVYRSSP
jgi:AraC-like DNA-binding protein